jgi:outer membrane protein assembly factor BamB
MTPDVQTPLPETAAPARSRILPVVRLILAWAVTLVFLPYAWGRTLVIWMMVGRPEPRFFAELLVGLLAVVALTYGLWRALAGFRFRRWVGPAVGLSWVLVNGALIWLRTGPLLPWPYVLPVFVPATLWVVWTAWMFYRPLRWRTRLGVLAPLLAALVVALLVLKAQGLTGGSDINFVWRWQGRSGGGAVEAAPGQTADLMRTTGHDYAQFLGPRRLGLLPDARLGRDWKQTPPRLVWRIPVGAGWGAFAVVGDYAVTQEQRGDDECVVCYRLADGSPVWVHADQARFDSSLGGPGPRATPTVAGGRVYTVGATGILNCLDGATGRPVWTVNILEDNGGKEISHGVCGSPLLVGDRVIVSPTGNAGASLAAYRRDTGERVWRAGQDEASYGSPLLAEVAGVRQVLLHNAEAVAGHDPATGRLLWSFPWTNSQHVDCSQPIPGAGASDQVFVSTGYGKGCALVRVERSAEAPWPVHAVWESNQLKTKFTSAVLQRGYVYGLDDGILECVDLKTGKRRWKDGRYEHGQVLLAGDLLLVQAEDGRVVLVEPNPEGLRELGRLRALDGKTWNNPALAGPFLLVRNDREAACYELPLEGQ